MEFVTQYSFIPQEGEDNDGVSIVEKAGYIPAKRQIEDMIDAGKRLRASRRELYDVFEGEGTEDEVSVRKPNYDLADASQDAMAARARLRKSEAERSQRIAADQAAVKVAGEAGGSEKK